MAWRICITVYIDGLASLALANHLAFQVSFSAINLIHWHWCVHSALQPARRMTVGPVGGPWWSFQFASGVGVEVLNFCCNEFSSVSLHFEYSWFKGFVYSGKAGCKLLGWFYFVFFGRPFWQT